jgi:hypothetical protein
LARAGVKVGNNKKYQWGLIGQEEKKTRELGGKPGR